MLLRLGFNQCCEIVGRVSAIIAVAGMASLVFAAARGRRFALSRMDTDVGLRMVRFGSLAGYCDKSVRRPPSANRRHRIIWFETEETA